MNICKAKSSLNPLRYLANSFLSPRLSATRCFSSQGAGQVTEEQKNSGKKTKDLFSEEQLARLRVGKDGQVFPTYTSKVGLPRTRKLYTVIRSPFVHKKSREQFEMRIHKQLLVIKAKPHELQKKFFWLKRQVFVGAQHEVTVKYQTRLPQSDLNKILNKPISNKKPEVVSRTTTK